MVWLFIGCVIGFYLVLGLGVYVWTLFVQTVEDVDLIIEEETSDHIELEEWKGEALDAAYEMAWKIND